MAKLKTLDLQFPIGGVARRYGYQQQSPYTTFDCENVWPADPLEGRERGGSRPGTAKALSTELESGSPLQLLAVVAILGADMAVANVLVAIANGQIYKSTNGTTFSVVTFVGVNSTAPTLRSTTLLQKHYIADFRPVRMVGTDGTLTSKVLSATSVADWTTEDIDITRDVALVTDVAEDDTEDGIYRIASVAAGGITLTAPGGLTDGSCNWEIGRSIKVFDPVASTIASLDGVTGLPPLNSPLICTYRGRLVAASGNTYFMSRQGDPTDWDYAVDVTDVQRAVASGNADAGFVPQPIRAMIPHTDDLLIFGCEREIWILKGDPAYGGTLNAISREVGIIAPSAWCVLPDSAIVFLSRQGLFAMRAGDASEPQPFSREALPEALLDVDVVSNTVSMEYDGRNQGIHVFVTPVAGTAGEHYFISWQTKGLFPVNLPNAQQPTCMVDFAVTQGAAEYVLQGCLDGYVRRYSRFAPTDDGTTLTSYVVLGPLALARFGEEAQVDTIGAVLDEDSDDVTWSLMVGATGEEVADQAVAKATGTWAAGYNRNSRPRTRGTAGKVKLLSTGKWAMESVHLAISPAGRKK